MSKILKSVCSVSLAVVMALLLPFSPAIAAVSVSDVSDQLYLDTPVGVTVTDENPSSYFYFIPEVSGVYFFSSSGSEDTYGSILDENGNTISSNDDGGNNQNFKVCAELTAGQTYILQSRLYSNGTGSFTVVIEKAKAVTSVDINDISIIEVEGSIRSDYNHETGEYVEWVCYDNYQYKLTGTITYEDGTTAELTNGYYIDGSYNYSNIDYFDNQSYNSPWIVGNNYEVTATVFGATGTFSVTIVENPVESITATPIELIENVDGYDNGSYFYYKISGNKTKVTVKLKDGTILSNYSYGSYDSYIYYNGEYYHINTSIEQSEESPLLAGNTYPATGTFLGYSFDMTVSIVENPVESIEVVNIESIYTNDYSYISDGTPIYSTPSIILKVSFKNGEHVIINEGYGVSDNQDKTPWTVGGENIITVSYMNKTTEVNVELIERDIEYIVQDGVAYITICKVSTESFVVPSEIDGYPVKGVIYLYSLDANVKELTIPDSVTYLETHTFAYIDSLETINIGSGVEEIDFSHFRGLENIKEINVSPNNKKYVSIDGVLYNKTLDKLIFYPLAQGDTYVVPPSVTDFTILYSDFYAGLNIDFGTGNDAVVTIDGVTYSGNMKCIFSCDPEKTGEYVMPDTVTSIAAGAFKESSLSKVTVSSGVTEIVYDVFAYATNLETVILPENLKMIDDRAFEESGLTSIDLPDSLKEIGDNAFYGTKLTSLEIPASVRFIDYSAFQNIETLTELTINNGVKHIGSSAFAGSSIKKIIIPDSVTYMGSEAFRIPSLEQITIGAGLSAISCHCFGATNITEITLPANIISIGSYAFYFSPKLTTVNIKAKNINIDDAAFENCPLLKSLNIESDSVTLGAEVFANTPIEKFDFEKVVGRISFEAFENSKLTSVVFPETVTEISYGAFRSSSLLEAVDFPDNIITLDPEAFEETPWYDNVYSKLPDGWVIYDNIFLGWKGERSGNWDTAPVLPEGVTSIVSDSLAYYATFSTIELPNSLRVIGIGAFQDNPNLTSIYIPENVEYISRTAFDNCFALSDIQVAENNPYYTAKDGALYNKDMTELIFCAKQESNVFTVPETVKIIVSGAFYTSGVDVLIFEGSDVELYSNEWYASDCLSVRKCVEGLTYDNRPTIICDTSADSKIYKFAQQNEYYTVDINTLSITSIEVGNNLDEPIKIGDNLPLNKLKLKVNYNAFSRLADITSDMVSGFDSSTAGVKTVTVTYEGVSTTFDVLVVGYATVSNKLVQPGETFDLILKVNSPVDCTSFAISNITFDNSKVELISGEWLVENLVIKNWDSNENMGAAAFNGISNLNGDLIKLTFKAKDNVEDGIFNINCDIKVRLDDTEIPFLVNAGVIKILNILPGDLNGDNKVTDADAEYLLMHTFYNSTYPANQDCDFNRDGKVTDADAIYLLMHTFFSNEYPLYFLDDYQ